MNWLAKFWSKTFSMLNRPLPAPEYRVAGYKDKRAVSKNLAKAMNWKAEKIILAHGDLIEGSDEVESKLKECWGHLILAEDK